MATGCDGNMILVTGPPDSGKSALLREFRDQLWKRRNGLFVYINMRSGTFNTASSFARELKGQTLVSFLPKAKLALSAASELVKSVKGTGAETEKQQATGTTEAAEPEVDADAALSPEGFLKLAQSILDLIKDMEKTEETDMQQPLAHLEGLFLNWRVLVRTLHRGETAGFPTLIIDEANRLHEWSLSPQEQEHLTTLQAWLLMITKEMGIANVILCSSEEFFKFWMSSRFGVGRYLPAVVGDLTEQEALAFFKQHLERSSGTRTSFPDELWTEIHDYCGGRMSILKTVAAWLAWVAEDEAAMKSSWEKFRRMMEQMSFREVYAGTTPETLLQKWTSPALEPCACPLLRKSFWSCAV